jgi:glycosyltransferase involved in cell wall biosynthesis
MLTLPPGTRRLFDVRRLSTVAYECCRGGLAEVVVVIPLYNYAGTIADCLHSVIAQTLPLLSVVVIDDGSTDDGAARAIGILRHHVGRFVTARVLRHTHNQGVSMARNSGIAWSKERYLFMLDADNRLRRPALSRLLTAIQCSGAAFVYPQLRLFGDATGLGHADIWDPARLKRGNYIDTSALIQRDALEASDGYAVLADDHGWEDYDLWCRFATLGLHGVFLPEVLCDYSVHQDSRTTTQTKAHHEAQMAEMALRYPALFETLADCPAASLAVISSRPPAGARLAMTATRAPDETD